MSCRATGADAKDDGMEQDPVEDGHCGEATGAGTGGEDVDPEGHLEEALEGTCRIKRVCLKMGY